MERVKWTFFLTFATTHSLLAAHSGDVPSWLWRNGIDEKPKYKILMKKDLPSCHCCSSSLLTETLVDGIYYNLYESENTAEVTSGTEYRGDIVIPASISVDGVDYSVTYIGSFAFCDWDEHDLTDDAFHCCRDLTSIEIPTSVTYIGDYAFHGCSGLTSIEIPTSVTEIGKYAFEGCSGLTSIEIPTSVTSIGSSAFAKCI